MVIKATQSAFQIAGTHLPSLTISALRMRRFSMTAMHAVLSANERVIACKGIPPYIRSETHPRYQLYSPLFLLAGPSCGHLRCQGNALTGLLKVRAAARRAASAYDFHACCIERHRGPQTLESHAEAPGLYTIQRPTLTARGVSTAAGDSLLICYDPSARSR